ncbi:MAG: MarR family transcriptional regulator [Firmicutes bacterium]|nr:MarR family transcriptional regulator [Bacillota bacterium]
MESKDYEQLKLKNQLCFPLYVCSKEIIRRYTPFLEKVDLTYTQYITMMAMWEHKKLTSKQLGKIMYLDSGTLTPLLKKLETKGYITRSRSENDERNLIIEITEEGEKLKDIAADIPKGMSACISLSEEEAKCLYSVLYKMIDNFKEN